MQTPATAFCGARAAALPTSPRCAGPPGGFGRPLPGPSPRARGPRLVAPMASTVDSPGSSSDFAKRIERAWLISKQPRPISCLSCQSAGHVECKWCAGTGFFILGNNILCEVPSKNTQCVICSGKVLYDVPCHTLQHFMLWKGSIQCASLIMHGWMLWH